MTDLEREEFRHHAADLDALLRRLGEKYPWLHPDYDPALSLWRERARRAWNDRGRRPRLY